MPDRIPILYLTDGGAIGGAEQRLLALAEHLPDRYEPHLITLGPRGPLHERMERLGAAARALDVSRRHEHALAVPRVAAHAIACRARIIHGQIRYAAFIACLAGRLARVPCVVTRSYTTRIGGIEAVDKGTARLADAIVAVSEAATRVLVDTDGAPRSRVHVIPNGIDVERFARAPPSDDPVFADRVVLCVGNLHAIKGHSFLIQALPEIVRTEPRARLVLIGSGPLERELFSLARHLGIHGRVSLLGYQDDPAPFLRAADLFVLPSLNEGMSHALLEAMAAGLAVVATSVGGNVETLGDAGILVPPEDPRALAREITSLLADRDRARDLGEAARQRARDRFSRERMVSAYAALYDRILGDRASAPTSKGV